MLLLCLFPHHFLCLVAMPSLAFMLFPLHRYLFFFSLQSSWRRCCRISPLCIPFYVDVGIHKAGSDMRMMRLFFFFILFRFPIQLCILYPFFFLPFFLPFFHSSALWQKHRLRIGSEKWASFHETCNRCLLTASIHWMTVTFFFSPFDENFIKSLDVVKFLTLKLRNGTDATHHTDTNKVIQKIKWKHIGYTLIWWKI